MESLSSSNPEGPIVQSWDLKELRRTLEQEWSIFTAAPGTDPFKLELAGSTGQCAATAWVVNQKFGGQYVSTKINGQSHWFNRLVVCCWNPVTQKTTFEERDVDLTGDQFGYPPINVANPGMLYPETRVRKATELNEETIRRGTELLQRLARDKTPRQYSLVRFKKDKYTPESIEQYYKDLIDKTFIYFGEIPNQPSHCVLYRVGTRNKDFVGEWELFRHVADFEEIPDDEN